MQSLSKTPISLSTAQEIVRHQFGNRTITTFEELKDGFFNASYKIGLDDGFVGVLKVAPPAEARLLRYEQGLMPAEVAVMRQVRAQTEMRVPEVFCYDPTGQIIPNEYFVMEFVPGISLHAARQLDPDGDFHAAEREVGRTLAQMNAVTGEAFGYATSVAARHTSWREAFAAMIEGVLLDGEEMGVELPLPYAEVRDRMEAAYPALDEVQTPCLVHWDLWDGNIFIDPVTRQLTGIIDFERAMWADPLIEQNFIGFGDPTAFLEGYGKVMPTTPNEHLRRTLYSIHLFLIIVIEHYYRQYPSNELEQWGRKMVVETFERLQVQMEQVASLEGAQV